MVMLYCFKIKDIEVTHDLAVNPLEFVATDGTTLVGRDGKCQYIHLLHYCYIVYIIFYYSVTIFTID